MSISAKTLLSMSLVAGAFSAGFAFWWTRLITQSAAACFAEAAPVGVDCRHDFQFYSAVFLAAVCLLFLGLASVRWWQHRSIPGAA